MTSNSRPCVPDHSLHVDEGRRKKRKKKRRRRYQYQIQTGMMKWIVTCAWTCAWEGQPWRSGHMIETRACYAIAARGARHDETPRHHACGGLIWTERVSARASGHGGTSNVATNRQRYGQNHAGRAWPYRDWIDHAHPIACGETGSCDGDGMHHPSYRQESCDDHDHCHACGTDAHENA